MRRLVLAGIGVAALAAQPAAAGNYIGLRVEYSQFAGGMLPVLNFTLQGGGHGQIGFNYVDSYYAGYRWGLNSSVVVPAGTFMPSGIRTNFGATDSSYHSFLCAGAIVDGCYGFQDAFSDGVTYGAGLTVTSATLTTMAGYTDEPMILNLWSTPAGFDFLPYRYINTPDASNAIFDAMGSGALLGRFQLVPTTQYSCCAPSPFIDFRLNAAGVALVQGVLDGWAAGRVPDFSIGATADIGTLPVPEPVSLALLGAGLLGLAGARRRH